VSSISNLIPLTRSTVATTWHWLWPDTLMRLVPMTLIPFLYIGVLHLPLSYLGLTLTDWPLQVLLGLLIGIGMALFSTTYRMLVVGPRFRRPTASDHVLQAIFYLLMNGPVEEFFFRGFLLTVVGQWTGWIGWGWLASTVIYTLYHRLGKWSWRSVGGVGLAGIVFSTLYVVQLQPWSLLTVVIVHGLTTWGFLSLGDEIMYQLWKRHKG
jgi:membrane protease YdiL (CAAX protease family)